MTVLGLLRIIASPTHSPGVPRQNLGKKWLKGHKWSPPPLNMVVPSRVFWRLWVSLNLGGFPVLSEKGGILLAWEFSPVLCLCTWHFTLSLGGLPMLTQQLAGVTLSTGLLSLSTADLGAPSFFAAGSCPVHQKVFTGIPVLYPLKASSTCPRHL